LAGVAALAIVLGSGTVAPAVAETLSEAIAAAYKFNPRLDAARATQRATDEEVPRAISGYRPSITGSADTNFQKSITSGPGTRSASSNRCSGAFAPSTR
jgi:outer membrane protein